MKQGCIFDLDGTLIDSIEDLANAGNYALKQLSYDTYSLEDYRVFVGNGVKKLIERIVPVTNPDIIKQAIDYFYEYYDKHCLDSTKPYPGIEALMNDLKYQNVKIAVVTNKPDYLAKKIVKALFKEQIEIVYGYIEDIPPKPNPTLVHKVLQEFSLQSEDCVYIGDSDVDIYTAQNASMHSIGCTWGNRSEQELKEAEASYIVHEASQIKNIVLGDLK